MKLTRSIPTAAVLVLLAALVCPAFSGEDPASQPTPPAASPDMSRGEWGYGPCREPIVVSFCELSMGVLALIMLGYFVIGLVRQRHDWKPLVLGLFCLGLGALDMTGRLILDLSVLAGKGGPSSADAAACVAAALVPLALGLIVAMAGGLFSVILRWRNERFRAQEAAEAEAAASDAGESP